MAEGQPRFRNSMGSQAGNKPAEVVQGKVANLNLVNWTVDVTSQFDRKRYFDIQVSSPYMHYSKGEGISVMPEVGAKVMVTLPSDSSPPYVSGFLMPVENTDMATADAPQGTTSQAKPNRTSSGASFAGGRPVAKPGDIMIRTRDDNFLILHRGGVLQIGSTELAQRIYIPLNNLIMDVSENYAHYNSGGSILWSVQSGPSLENLPTEYTHVARIYANDKSADIRVKMGKVTDLVPEPGDGNQGDISNFGMNTKDNFTIAEVTVGPNLFNPQTGTVESNTPPEAFVMKYFFDRAGNFFFRTRGNVMMRTHKKLKVEATGGIAFKTDADFSVVASGGATIDGGPLAHLKGSVVRLGPGAKPVATQGSLVQIILPFTPIPIPGSPPLTLFGTILTGSPSVLA